MNFSCWFCNSPTCEGCIYSEEVSDCPFNQRFKDECEEKNVDVDITIEEAT